MTEPVHTTSVMTDGDLAPFTEEHRAAVRKLEWVGAFRGGRSAMGRCTDVNVLRVFVPGAGMTEAERLEVRRERTSRRRHSHTLPPLL